MSRFKKLDEYYLTKPLAVKSDSKGAAIVFDAGAPVHFIREDASLGYIFNVRNTYISVSLTENVVDDFISDFDEEAVRRAK